MKLFLDCDGVLADFDKRALDILKMPSREFEAVHGAKAFWHTLYSTPDFFTLMDPMPDAYELFEAVEHLDPIILTGEPRGGWAKPQKLAWRDKYFPQTEMIVCPARDKKLHMRPGDIIVDDWPQHRQAWEDAGGIWVAHKSAADSIAQLKALGVI